MKKIAVSHSALAVVATWPEEWQDGFAQREAIMAVDASQPDVPAIREAFKDVVRVVERMGCHLSGPCKTRGRGGQGKHVKHHGVGAVGSRPTAKHLSS